MRATHEGLRIFCHFFNNNKTCPFNNGCVFIHEDSEVCERRKCMYKHGVDDSGDELENVIEEEDKDETDSTHSNGGIEDGIYVGADNNKEDESEVDEDPNDENVPDDNLEEGPEETLEFDVFVPCRDHFLTKDSGLYHQQLNNMKEIGRVQNIWITAKSEYKVCNKHKIYNKIC